MRGLSPSVSSHSMTSTAREPRDSTTRTVAPLGSGLSDHARKAAVPFPSAYGPLVPVLLAPLVGLPRPLEAARLLALAWTLAGGAALGRSTSSNGKIRSTRVRAFRGYFFRR